MLLNPNTLCLVPAYGRRYSTVDAMKSDWKGGKEFKIVDGPYCSIRDRKALQAYDRIALIQAGHGKVPHLLSIINTKQLNSTEA